jgi:hypothetical protein
MAEVPTLASLALHSVAKNPGVVMMCSPELLSSMPEDMLVAVAVLSLRKHTLHPLVAKYLREVATELGHERLAMVLSSLDIERGMSVQAYNDPCK